jgi:hypothetical protein
MKNESRAELHSLPAFTSFTWYGKKYRTMTPIKEGKALIPTCKKKKREVLDLKTFKTRKLLYFTKVLIFSE